MDSQTPFLHVVMTSLPEHMSTQLKQFSNETLLENLIRFICGAECHGSPGSEKEWTEKQAIVRTRLAELGGMTLNGNKRQREEDDGQESNNKRLKTNSTPSNDNEPSLFTLNSISTTSPVRKKVNIKIHQSSIRFYHPTTHAVEATIPLSSLRRGFLIPTRGKSKPHWTVILISTDVLEKEKGKAASASSQANQQIIFGLDAVAASPITAINTNGATLTVKKGDETLPTIKLFLSHLGFPIYEPSTDVFKSALPGNSPDGVPGVEAYRGAKAGNLWFMSQGILWGESKPCEFFAVEDLINKDEGLRMMSATGRTVTLIVVRKTNDSDREEGEEDVGEESQFSLIDGKEQDGINRWIKHHRHLFGGKNASSGGDEKSGASKETTSAPAAAPLVSGPMTLNQMSIDSDDEEDEDFAAKSDDESGGSGVSDEGDSDNSDADGEADEEEAVGSEDGDGDEEEEELKPEHHPLLRPGAMPRMSRAAIDMVVDMVADDLVGSGQASDEEDQLADD
ncbi:hypothetical protein D9758_015687 [Tetrapyrgos nigripes]|uniref:Histone chaperone RTT106/FACT complex subunit SPT16-like middle domain-containing protein n=1 Tax=Tetrapyrgos nigripes TaxID=182062 RepID=A0A8H5C839_9AGAR|nr:hypothetical protein D9758_015687 [Tetrapyrgos nigripes]